MHRIAFLMTALSAASLFAVVPTTGPTKVTFGPDGIAVVNGERFFPIGIWLYELSTNVMADIHEHRFNTVVGNGFKPEEFDTLQKHGLMAVPILQSPDWIDRLKNHPSLLAWYLHDEPEGGGKKAQDMVTAYKDLKKKDPNHPIGLDHFLWEALITFKDACDFTMTDTYPILASRDGIMENVGKFVDESHRIHGANWPHWCFIQIFGGPETDGGKWAQPLPHEVRCMVFDALVHRANGILYFSYWPKAPQTWASVAELNQDLERILPWILAKDGKEITAKSSQPAIHLRARKIAGGGTMIMAVNVLPKFFDVTIETKELADAELRLPYENRTKAVAGGKFTERFAPFEAKVYLAGPEPVWP